MSSKAVRDAFLQFLDDESNEDVVVLMGDTDELRDLLANSGIQPNAPWLGVQFIGDAETPISLTANNKQGCYREIGTIVLHICAEAKVGVGNSILNRGETLRNLIRGENIGGILVEGVSPVNFGLGATLEFDDGYASGSFSIDYHYDTNLG